MPDPRLDQLGTRIRDTRQAAGLTLATVATAAGIGVPYLSLIETGQRVPALDVLLRVADALGVTAGRLLD